MKIKPLNKKKPRPAGKWIEGHFYAEKQKRRGRLPQLNKSRRIKVKNP